ncbi:hypothetical protein ACFWGR_35435 [Streptomyces sp. NPDC060311]|uniref:hypothetical protein n=1 Tax=Streptomyces sp. NPDC060311 TaxID=3347096 RepID=UPI0036681C40
MAHHPLWTLTYTSPDVGKRETGNQQRVNALVQMDLAVNSPKSKKSYSQAGAFTSSVRFDYAGRIAGKFKGAVFRQARVELQLSLSDTAITESTRHIRDAQQQAERTFPSWVGKASPEPPNRCTAWSTRTSKRPTAEQPSQPAKTSGAITAAPGGSVTITPSQHEGRRQHRRRPLLGPPRRR